MSFDHQYKNRKDHREQYYDEREFDATCRSHGSCGCRKRKRDYKINKQLLKEDDNYE